MIFDKFCRERYVDKSRKISRAVSSEEKTKGIRQAVKGEHSPGAMASFRHWVNRTKYVRAAKLRSWS